MTSKAEFIPFLCRRNHKCQQMSSTWSFGFAFRLISCTYNQQRLPFWPALWLVCEQPICKNMWDPQKEKKKKKVGQKKKKACDYQQQRGCLFNVCPTVHTHLDTHSLSAERPKDSRAPMETVISGVKREGEGEERRRRSRRRKRYCLNHLIYVI